MFNGETQNVPGSDLDAQRGREYYSNAEKAYRQFNETADVALRNAQFTEDERQQRLRQQEELHQQFMRHNEGLYTLQLAILAAAGSGQQVSINDLIAAIGQQMSKNASNTPPQTGG